MIITIQDFKSRSIWWFLPLLLFLSGLFAINPISIKSMFSNVLFVGSILLFLGFYLRFRFGKEGTKFFNYFGLGDVLFLFAITPFFHLDQFVYFFTIGTCFALTVHLLLSIFRSQKNIPYAGYLSICLFSFLIFKKLDLQFINSIFG